MSTMKDDDDREHETAATIASFAKTAHREHSELRVHHARSPENTPPQRLFSSIGLGIDASASADATEAALKAVRDALDRSVFNWNRPIQLNVRVGVPGCPTLPHQPLAVNAKRVSELLPTSASVMPMEVVLGGLMAPDNVCTVVACLTAYPLVQQASAELLPGVSSPTSVASNAVPHDTSNMGPPATWAEVERSMNEAPAPAPAPAAEPHSFHRSTSIDMLARISAEMHEQEPDHDDEKASGNYSYRKLPPGTTPKNNTRLFVKHTYRDFSQELPRSDELDLLSRTAPSRTPNAAFPLKLHETLRQIEIDGLDSIIGWQPHGRSFKIRKQKEFVDVILPKYFVMTKKSSFLRQLNLYGFNRLSGIGPDQGSYYHEKFLRGIKFLSRRMQRQKVNGNGIRAAGNPDDEPNLNLFPPCPPLQNGPLPLPAERPTGLLVASATAALEAANNQAAEEDLCEGHDPILKASAGAQVSFPLKLQRILDKLESEGRTDVISWLSHGRAFLVKDSQRFVDEIMPVYFNQSKYSSFQRQLHMYNFARVTGHSPDKGAYHHRCFLRGHPELALKMRRTRVNGKGTRRPGNPNEEPDFYIMEPIPVIAEGTIIDIPLENGPLSADNSDDER